jgi:hypothetical protein
VNFPGTANLLPTGGDAPDGPYHERYRSRPVRADTGMFRSQVTMLIADEARRPRSACSLEERSSPSRHHGSRSRRLTPPSEERYCKTSRLVGMSCARPEEPLVERRHAMCANEGGEREMHTPRWAPLGPSIRPAPTIWRLGLSDVCTRCILYRWRMEGADGF